MSDLACSSAHPHPFEITPIAREIWDKKYRLRGAADVPDDATVDDTFRRVARAAAQVEPEAERAHWQQQFHAAMADFGFLPAGRILAGAGTGRKVTLFNCFVLGAIPDDLGGIFGAVREAALTMQQGGGIGHDFSTLRPNGALVASIGAGASGPISFMDVWDAMCRTIMSAGARRGAMMGTMRCDHPDIETFIDAKRDAARLRNFNLSVLVTDPFIAAVVADEEWELVFGGRCYKRIPARALWDRLMRATYETAEPGVIFIDRINATNNLGYCETIHATNPCGEQPLPPYGACLLGSINLARLVCNPLTDRASIDEAVLEARVEIAVRLLDNAIDISGYPLPSQRAEAMGKRRIGLGVTGLADALALCGLDYRSPQAVACAESWMARITRAAYLASARLAAEKGPFPLYDAKKLLAGAFIARLDRDVRDEIARSGLRNGCVTSIAPTGTISLLAGNVSSGIEPIFARQYTRRVLQPDGSHLTTRMEDYACALARRLNTSSGSASVPVDDAATFVTIDEIAPDQHLAMQAALQRHVDSSISKTINLPESMSFDAFKDVYLDAYRLGLKGCTTFRPNSVTGSVLASEQNDDATRAGTDTAGNSNAGESPMAAPATGVEVLTQVVSAKNANVPRPLRAPTDVVNLSEPLAREEALAGYTYKLRWPGSDHAIYVTINDIEHDGCRRPFEIFINTKSLEHSAWMVALTRMISAVFRRGGDVSFVVEELKAIYDPQGGQFIGGSYVPSIQAAIGGVIERHLVRIGFMPSPRAEAPQVIPHVAEKSGPPSRECPRCGELALMRVEGCWVCRSCAYSRCG